MLVLGRKPGQEIVIGESVTLRVLNTNGGHVRIGIVAPTNIKIRRGELEPHKNEGNEAA